MLCSVTTPSHIRDVYSPDSNDSGIVSDHSMTSRRYRHMTNPEPEAAEISDEKSRQQQVGITTAVVTTVYTRTMVQNVIQDTSIKNNDVKLLKYEVNFFMSHIYVTLYLLFLPLLDIRCLCNNNLCFGLYKYLLWKNSVKTTNF